MSRQNNSTLLRFKESNKVKYHVCGFLLLLLLLFYKCFSFMQTNEACNKLPALLMCYLILMDIFLTVYCLFSCTSEQTHMKSTFVWHRFHVQWAFFEDCCVVIQDVMFNMVLKTRLNWYSNGPTAASFNGRIYVWFNNSGKWALLACPFRGSALLDVPASCPSVSRTVDFAYVAGLRPFFRQGKEMAAG